MQSNIHIESLIEYEKLYKQSDGLSIDLRNQKEYKKGHLKGSIHLDLMSKHFVEYFTDLSKTKTLFLYCMDGSRSKVALRILNEMGFTDVHHLKNGIEMFDDLSESA